MLSVDTPKDILKYNEAEVLHLASKFNYTKLNVKAKAKIMKMMMKVFGFNMTPDIMLATLADPKNKLILACAGAGKTSTIHVDIVRNKIFHYLIKKDFLPSHNILFISFSEASVKDTEYRHSNYVNKIKKSKLIPEDGIADGITCKTVHGFCNSWFQDYLGWFGYPQGQAMLSNDDETFIERIEASANLLRKKFTIPDFDAKKTLEVFRQAQEMLIPLDSQEIYDIYPELPMDPEIFGRLFKQFQISKRNRGLYDYTDMLTGFLRLTEENDGFIERMSKNYSFIYIDESQDLNPIMLKIAENLSKLIRVTIIADEDQSIYRFRGARPQYLSRFKEVFEDSGVFTMVYNRRCRQLICDAASNIISLNDFRFDKFIKPMKPGGEILFEGYVNEEEQLDRIVEIIKGLDAKELPKTSIAVRDNMNTMYITHKLTQEGIYYRLLNGQHAYSHRIYDVIKIVLQIITKPFDASLKEHLNKVTPARAGQLDEVLYLPNGQLDVVKAGNHFFDIDYGPLENVKDFRNCLDILNDISVICKVSPVSEYVNPIFGLVKRFFWDYQCKLMGENNPRMAAYNNYFTQEAYNFFNQDYTASELLDMLDRKRSDLRSISDAHIGVTVGNIHSHKGLEFENVHLAYMDSEIFPVVETNSKMSEEAIQTAYESENSLAYVAYTRAETKLYLHYNLNSPSPYVTRTKEFLSTYSPEPIQIPYINIDDLESPEPVEYEEKEEVMESLPVDEPQAVRMLSDQLFAVNKQVDEEKPVCPIVGEDSSKVDLDYDEVKKEAEQEKQQEGLVAPNNPSVISDTVVKKEEPKARLNSFMDRFRIR